MAEFIWANVERSQLETFALRDFWGQLFNVFILKLILWKVQFLKNTVWIKNTKQRREICIAQSDIILCEVKTDQAIALLDTSNHEIESF